MLSCGRKSWKSVAQAREGGCDYELNIVGGKSPCGLT